MANIFNFRLDDFDKYKSISIMTNFGGEYLATTEIEEIKTKKKFKNGCGLTWMVVRFGQQRDAR